MKLAHKCDACSRTFPTQRGLKIHAARWCEGGVTQRSHRGSLADRFVQTAKRRAAEATLRSRMSTRSIMSIRSSIWGRDCNVKNKNQRKIT